ASAAIDAQLAKIGGGASVAVLKSVVTQASSAIPVMPLYLAMVFKVMREKGIHEGCMDQIYRMFAERLYNNHNPAELTDDK
ncbi:bifunctional NADH-specific enoyl-ACP reductase/trans-2-enoyl-CoA reductase, partial [Domibacillus sp. 8LH]